MALGIIQVNEQHAPGTFLLFDESSAHLSSQMKYGTGKVITGETTAEAKMLC